MTIIRIGLGRSASGAVLDSDTTWFNDSEKAHAIEQAIKTKKPIFVSINGRAYREITLEQLKIL